MFRITMKLFVLVVASSAFIGTAMWWPGRNRNDFASVQMTPHQEGPKGFMSLLQVEAGVKSELRSQEEPPKRQDPYAEPDQGESSADEWCASGGGSDPLCDANAEVVDIEAELHNIENFMSCRRAANNVQCLCKTDPGNAACTQHKPGYETIEFENEAAAELAAKKKKAEQEEKAADEKKAEAVKTAEEHKAAEKDQEDAKVAEEQASKKAANAKQAVEVAKEAAVATKEQAEAAQKAAAEMNAQAEGAAAKAAEAAPAEKEQAEATARVLEKKAEEATTKAETATEEHKKAEAVVKEAEAAEDSAVKEEAKTKEELQAKEAEANKEGKTAAEAAVAAEAAERKAVEAKAVEKKAETKVEVWKKLGRHHLCPRRVVHQTFFRSEWRRRWAIPTLSSRDSTRIRTGRSVRKSSKVL